MKNFTFKKIDAFATEKSAGNPAGYIKLNSFDEISEKEMLQIAKELKGFVSEVGYAVKKSETEFDLRYYSSEREVDFCGHATIAILYDIIKTTLSLRTTPLITINNNKGKLIVENRLNSENAIFIMSPVPEKKRFEPNIPELAQKLKTNDSSIDLTLPISAINAGLTTLIVPIKDLESILAISPDLDELNEFCVRNNIDIIEVFTSDVFDKNNNFRTRVFAPTLGYIEDPATGSGNSAFGYYLLENSLWKGETISIEQNGLKDNFNIVKLQKKADESGATRVYFGGGAITRIEGKYLLSE